MYWNSPTQCFASSMYRLIETWDVLKWCQRIKENWVGGRLIETWDVLKFPSAVSFNCATCFD